jgi:hypothetical protein
MFARSAGPRPALQTILKVKATGPPSDLRNAYRIVTKRNMQNCEVVLSIRWLRPDESFTHGGSESKNVAPEAVPSTTPPVLLKISSVEPSRASNEKTWRSSVVTCSRSLVEPVSSDWTCLISIRRQSNAPDSDHRAVVAQELLGCRDIAFREVQRFAGRDRVVVHDSDDSIAGTKFPVQFVRVDPSFLRPAIESSAKPWNSRAIYDDGCGVLTVHVDHTWARPSIERRIGNGGIAPEVGQCVNLSL